MYATTVSIKKYHISIFDGGADIFVLGQGWKVLSFHDKGQM
jgi:hypothetical protein